MLHIVRVWLKKAIDFLCCIRVALTLTSNVLPFTSNCCKKYDVVSTLVVNICFTCWNDGFTSLDYKIHFFSTTKELRNCVIILDKSYAITWQSQETTYFLDIRGCHPICHCHYFVLVHQDDIFWNNMPKIC